MFSLATFPLLALLAVNNQHSKSYLKTDHLVINKIKESLDGVVWVDVENVRGKSGFGLTHDEALAKTSIWTKHHNLEGKVIFVVDHGSLKSAYYLAGRELGVIFAGPSEKADDTIAHNVGLFGTSLVITADGELKSRCRRAAQEELHIMDPAKFLDDIEMTFLQSGEGEVESVESTPLLLEEQVTLGKLDDEIRLRGQLLDAEIQLGKKKKCTNKKRKKLQAKVNNLRTQLALRGPSLLDRVTSIDPNMSGTDAAIGKYEQDLLLSRWKELQHRSSRREQTGDRVVYAERLRRQLLESEDAETEFADTNLSGARSLVKHINGLSGHASVIGNVNENVIQSKPVHLDTTSLTPPEFSTYELLMKSPESGESIETLKMVVISDTHGFESQFTETLPDGDILIHLGDFALEGSSYEDEHTGLKSFDVWLAKQPHKYKIVVRGNHDPWKLDFPFSRAWFITEPCTVMIGQTLKVAMVPYGSPRKLAATGQIPTSCDILATHVPPFKVLDRTYTNKNVGSSFLSKMARSMKKGAPKLWLCGHIHEGRGIKKYSFGKNGETTVINAANANSGRATHLSHNPIVVEIDAKTAGVENITGVEERSIDQIPSNARFFEQSGVKFDELLLAVDLGLKSGVSMFSSTGRLLRYQQFTFERETLVKTIEELIQQWESDANDDMKVTHIAIEGGDVDILSAWASAASNLSLLRVSPEEWRSDLLLSKEKSNGVDAKAAARLIARQVVADYGVMEPHKGKFKTDVAEAVVLGLYVARKMGWISREPAVRRFTNGNVVVPR